jgi:NAD+ synthase
MAMRSRKAANSFSAGDPDETIDRIVRFLRTHSERIGARCLVVGMSGGLDSSVTAALCSKALGGKRTLGFCLPEAQTRSQRSIRDAEEVAKRFGVRFRSTDITALVQCAAGLLHPSKKKESVIPYGNLKARLRAMILYYYANTSKGLVVGTGDKSEIMLGYFTKYGDGACDIQPIADLYKTAVRDLARHLGIPRRIFSKPSSPELWPGQIAEDELGLSYSTLDPILWRLERWIPPEEISDELRIPLATVRKVRNRWLHSEHKRRPPLALKLGFRTAGQDLRIPYSL